MSQIKTTPEIDNAYAAGKITKQEYYFKCRTMNPLLDANDDTLALLRDKDIASYMDTLDRDNGAVNPNNYKDIFYENIHNDAIGLGVAAALFAAPYIANGAAMGIATAIRGGRYLAMLTYTSLQNLLKAPMPTTIGGNVAFTLGVSSFYDYMKQTPDPKNSDLAKLGFDMALNRTSFSSEDKDFLKNLFAEERIANIEEQRKLFEKFNETLEQGLGNIVQHQMLKEKAQQDEREKLATFQNSLTVFTYFIGKIEPELGRAVKTIGNVGMNIVKLATNVTKMGLSFVVGMAAAILPIFDLFLGDNEDIAQKRHEEVMKSLNIISNQLITIQEKINQRFDLLHDHLQRVELQMAKNFHSIFLTLGEMDALLRNIASDIANTQYSIKGSIVEIKTKLKNLITTVQILDSERYINDLKREQSALELYHNIKYNNIDLAKSLNVIFIHADNTSYLSSFIDTVIPSNALYIFGQNVLKYMHYANNLASLNENEKLPNIPEFCRAVDMLIYYSILFSNEPDIHKISRLADLQLKIGNIQKALKKATAKSLIQHKHSEYVNAANQVAEAFIEAMRNIEIKHFGSFSIPTMYSSFLLYKEPSVYLYTSISDTNDVISDIPISIFREDGGYVTTGVGDNNIVEMLKKLGILNITYGSKLSNEEKSKFQVDEQHESACYVTFDFRNSVDANISFPLAGFSPECIAIKSYTEGKVVFCVDVRNLKNKIITKLDTPFFVSRSSALFNRKLEELNFVQLLYLNVDFFVYKAKKSIAIEARKSIEYNDVIKKFEKAAAGFLYLTTLNRVCTNPISVYKHVNESFQGHDNNNELGYLIDYTEQLYTLADIEYLAHSYLNNNSNEDYALQNPTDSVISAISSIINNKIKDSTTIMGNVGNPEEYCCPPVLQEVINRLTIYVKMQSTGQ